MQAHVPPELFFIHQGLNHPKKVHQVSLTEIKCIGFTPATAGDVVRSLGDDKQKVSVAYTSCSSCMPRLPE